MLVYTRQKNIAQVFILERYFFDVYILASRIRLPMGLLLEGKEAPIAMQRKPEWSAKVVLLQQKRAFLRCIKLHTSVVDVVSCCV